MNSKQKKPIYWKNQEPPSADKEFTDPLFPPNENSLLGLDSSKKPIDSNKYETEKDTRKNMEEIDFFRAKEIIGENYCLFSEKIEIDDVKQGALGDCYFITSVANLCKFPDKLKKMFKQKTKNEKGFYEIELCIDGKKQIVIVDDYLPAYKNTKQACYAKPIKNQIWVMLLEKAWAKVNGGYLNIIAGKTPEALEFLTGRGSISYLLKDKKGEELNNMKRKILKRVQLADSNNCVISCSSTDDENNSEKIKNETGLISSHAYSIIGFVKIKTKEGKEVFLFKIRNPHSQGEWIGDWSDKSELWDEVTKSQVKLEDKDDGIFFINEKDFFKYFIKVEICFLFLDSEEVIYEIEGEENLKNGSVFLIETKEEGFLNISVPRENWRVHRNLKDKRLPTYISVVKCEPSTENKLKAFSNYNGFSEANENCTLNSRITKGKYLIYVYRDFDHSEYEAEKILIVKITFSGKYKHAQMSYDERDKGFPLLQNIILQAVLEEYNYDPDLGKEFHRSGNKVKGSPFGYLIKYMPTPGYYLKMEGSIEKMENFFIISPYLDSKTKSFHRAIPSGKFLVLLGMYNGIYGTIFFNCDENSIRTADVLNPEFDNNDIDLTLFTDFNNKLKSPNFQEKKLKCLENSKKEFYNNNNKTDGKIEYKPFDELQKEYGDYLKLLNDIQIEEPKKTLNWGIIKNEYFIFIGQFNSSNYKEGKGIYINPHNIFLGQFSGDCQSGKGYTYNKNFQKLFYYMYELSQPKGDPVLAEKDLEAIEKEKLKKEKELKEEQERLKKIKEEKEALLKKKEKELVVFLLNAQKEKKKKEEMELAKKKEEEEEKRKQEIEKEKDEEEEEMDEEQLKREIEREKFKEELAKKLIEMQEKAKKGEEETKIQAQKKAEEAKKHMEEIKNQLKEAKDKEQKVLDDINKNQLELKKTVEERKKIEQKKREKELERLEKEKENEFGVPIYYPEYLIDRNKNKRYQTQEENGVCLTCACNIF